MRPQLPIPLLTITLALASLPSVSPTVLARGHALRHHHRGRDARGRLARVVIDADSNVISLGALEERREDVDVNPLQAISSAVSQVSGALGNVTTAVNTVLNAVTNATNAAKNASTSVNGADGHLVVAATTRSLGDPTIESFSISDVLSGIVDGIVNAVDGAKNTIADVASAIANVANTIAGVATSAASIASALQPLLVPVAVGGHSKEDINKAVVWALAAVAIATLAGVVLDVLFPPADEKVGRPRFWLCGMLLASFAVLIPGLTEVLFSFTVAIEILGLHVTVTQSGETAGPITESTLSVIGLLWSSGSPLGALLIILYAMVIPVAKLLLLGLGELWRCSEDQSCVHIARRCIKLVQTLSKWACPDMFAYILLLYLVRSLDLRSSTIEAPAQLDVGFICFSIFCTFSTITSLAIHLPPKPKTDSDVAAQGQPLLLSWFGRRGIFWAAAVALCVFSILLVGGLCAPVMHMSLDDSLLVQPQGPLPEALEPLLTALNLSSQVNTDVSFMACITSLIQWFYYGEASCVLALVMLLGFATLFPVLDMLCLLAAAIGLPEEQLEKGKRVGHTLDSKVARSASRMLKHLSMLDVAIMGVVVVSYAAGVYKDQGIVIGMSWGIYLLIAAEVVHYLTYHAVQNSLRFLDPPSEEIDC